VVSPDQATHPQGASGAAANLAVSRVPEQPAGPQSTGPASRSASQSIAAVERAIDVLLLFGRSERADLGVTEISTQLGLSKAAVHRILTSLRSRDLVAVDPVSRRYSLGPAALSLGRAYLSRIDVRAMAAPELSLLSRTTDETVTLSIRNGDTRMYVEQVVPSREVRMEVAIGVPYPLHAGGSSKAFLAFLTDEEIDSYLARHGLDALTRFTMTNADNLRADLNAIRLRGYARSVGERQAGAASVAAPVFDQAGRPVAVISVSGPEERFTPKMDSAARLLMDATARLSARMGYPGD
jgi:IclR family transcriptional regulator, acetate operon repressor